MIIPIKCVTCGEVLADKYVYYTMEVNRQKLNNNEQTATQSKRKMKAKVRKMEDLGLSLETTRQNQGIIKESLILQKYK